MTVVVEAVAIIARFEYWIPDQSFLVSVINVQEFNDCCTVRIWEEQAFWDQDLRPLKTKIIKQPLREQTICIVQIEYIHKFVGY